MDSIPNILEVMLKLVSEINSPTLKHWNQLHNDSNPDISKPTSSKDALAGIKLKLVADELAVPVVIVKDFSTENKEKEEKEKVTTENKDIFEKINKSLKLFPTSEKTILEEPKPEEPVTPKPLEPVKVEEPKPEEPKPEEPVTPKPLEPVKVEEPKPEEPVTPKPEEPKPLEPVKAEEPKPLESVKVEEPKPLESLKETSAYDSSLKETEKNFGDKVTAFLKTVENWSVNFVKSYKETEPKKDDTWYEWFKDVDSYIKEPSAIRDYKMPAPRGEDAELSQTLKEITEASKKITEGINTANKAQTTKNNNEVSFIDKKSKLEQIEEEEDTYVKNIYELLLKFFNKKDVSKTEIKEKTDGSGGLLDYLLSLLDLFDFEKEKPKPGEKEPKPGEKEPKPEEPKPEEPKPEEPVTPKPEEPVTPKPEEPKPEEPVTPKPEEPKPEEPVTPKPEEPKPEEPKPEEPVTPKPEEPITPKPEEPITPKPEEPVTPKPEEPVTPKPEEPVTPKPEEPVTPKPEEPITPKPEEPVTPKPEELVTPKPEEPITPKPEEPKPEELVTPKPEEPITPKPEEPVTPKPEEPVTPKPEEPVTPKPEEPVTSVGAVAEGLTLKSVMQMLNPINIVKEAIKHPVGALKGGIGSLVTGAVAEHFIPKKEEDGSYTSEAINNLRETAIDIGSGAVGGGLAAGPGGAAAGGVLGGIINIGTNVYKLGKTLYEGAKYKDQSAAAIQESNTTLEKKKKEADIEAQELGFANQEEQLQAIKDGIVKPNEHKPVELKPEELVKSKESTPAIEEQQTPTIHLGPTVTEPTEPKFEYTPATTSRLNPDGTVAGPLNTEALANIHKSTGDIHEAMITGFNSVTQALYAIANIPSENINENNTPPSSHFNFNVPIAQDNKPNISSHVANYQSAATAARSNYMDAFYNS